MARIATPGPDVEADITREQVAAYLLSTDWHECRPRGALRVFQFGADGHCVSVDPEPTETTIRLIAQVEKAHPSTVLRKIARRLT